MKLFLKKWKEYAVNLDIINMKHLISHCQTNTAGIIVFTGREKNIKAQALLLTLWFCLKKIKERYNHKDSIEEYIKNPYNIDNQEIISESDALLEDIIFGIRMKKGINLYNLEKKFGKIDKSMLNKIEKNIKLGLLEKDDVWLKTTQKGSLVLESLSCSLLP